MLDAALATRVSSLLDQNTYLPGRHLDFEAQQGRVIIRGVVRSYYQKQMAQEIVRGIEGVSEIENQLEVDWN